MARGPHGISKAMRLQQRVDYLHVQKGGVKVHGHHLLALVRRRTNAALQGRLGVTVTKKVGNAVVRNRIRRLVREWMRVRGWVPRGWDVVLVAKDSAARQGHASDFAPDLQRLLQRLA
jgi:ribonuclease P protein component